MKIIAFAKFIGYNAGGAELSTKEILKKFQDHSEISLASVRNAKFQKGIKFEKWSNQGYSESLTIPTICQFGKFAFSEYLVNFPLILYTFNKFNSYDLLITYGIWAPAAALGFKKKSIIYLRSEADLGVIRNYDSGLRWFAKYIYMLLESPALIFYRLTLKLAAKKSRIIANSKFMAEQFDKLYGASAEIEYPIINIQLIEESFRKKSALIPDAQKGVVFIGDSQIKGIATMFEIIKLARTDLNFYIFQRFPVKFTNSPNVHYLPWQNDPADIYKFAKVVVVPSICPEA